MTINIKPSSVISNNQSLRVFESNGLKYPVEPIKQLVSITFNNLESKKVHKFTLDTNYYLNLKYITCVDKEFEDQAFSHPNNQTRTNNYDIVLRQITQNNKILDNLVLSLNVDDSNDLPFVIFPPQSSWLIFLNETSFILSQLTFYCEIFNQFDLLEYNFSSITEVEIIPPHTLTIKKK